MVCVCLGVLCYFLDFLGFLILTVLLFTLRTGAFMDWFDRERPAFIFGVPIMILTPLVELVFGVADTLTDLATLTGVLGLIVTRMFCGCVGF